MTYPTKWAQWLAVAARDERGGLSAEPVSISRGRECKFTVNLPTSTEFGDWSAGQFTCDLRSSPDAEGEPLASYTVTPGIVGNGSRPITFKLGGADQAGLPASDESGLAEVLLEITFTPSGGDERSLIATRQMVSGAV